jgi:hypothetical protein
MVVARSTGATSATAEAMTSMDGGIAMSKTWVDVDWVVAGNLGQRWTSMTQSGRIHRAGFGPGRRCWAGSRAGPSGLDRAGPASRPR